MTKISRLCSAINVFAVEMMPASAMVRLKAPGSLAAAAVTVGSAGPLARSDGTTRTGAAALDAAVGISLSTAELGSRVDSVPKAAPACDTTAQAREPGSPTPRASVAVIKRSSGVASPGAICMFCSELDSSAASERRARRRMEARSATMRSRTA